MTEHPFAEYVRTLGRGRRGAKPLSADQALAAMRMILNEQATPEQIGAYLMLMRVREETPEETAGMILAVRETLPPPSQVKVDLDWPSYAGKRRHLPWFVLSARLLAQNGVKILMHGSSEGPTDRVFARAALSALDLPIAESLTDALHQVEKHHFAFLELNQLHPRLAHLFGLRSVLGLRSPINTVTRMINPGHATFSLQSVFHPNYAEIHSLAGVILGEANLCIFKGEGGEVERNPDTACNALTVRHGVASAEEWPALFEQRHLKDERMDVDRLTQIWAGAARDEYGEAAVIGTTAMALRLLGRAQSAAEGMALATSLWGARNR